MYCYCTYHKVLKSISVPGALPIIKRKVNVLYMTHRTVPSIYRVSKISVDSVDYLENNMKEGYLANPI